jgi:hypothetical protein
MRSQIVVAILLVSCAAQAFAQGQPVERRINKLEQEMRAVQRRVFPGGCFFAAATLEFDDRPGPVRDRLEAGQRAWISYIAHHAGLAGHEDPRQLAFEMYALVLGTNATHQLLGEPDVFVRARQAMTRLLQTPVNG